MSTTTGIGPPLRAAAGVIVGVEAAALVAVGVWFVTSALTRDDAGAMSIGIAVLAAAGGAALGWVSIALWRGSTSPRGLGLTWQVLQCAVGVTVLEWSAPAGVVIIVSALTAAALLIGDARRDAPSASGGGADAPGAEDGSL
ncbi:hypothetical protein ACNI3K_04930 [Demequina sp. SO4-13]|uniref:hypothetical protein n=1 Tax=Demequina sp. SO4-13 TaxID=3401027 RepID=UPI003AF89746